MSYANSGSIGSILVDVAETKLSTGPESYSPGYGARLGWDLPKLPDGSQPYKDGTALLRNIPDNVDAFQVWLGAVSGLRFGGDEVAARAGGEACQPNWDYKVTQKGPESEAVGNVMFAYTGYMLFMDILEEAGVPSDIASPLVEMTLRGGGGAFQVYNDLKKGRFDKVDHNWYGEEVKDVDDIEAGLKAAKAARMEESLARLGIRVDGKALGLDGRMDERGPRLGTVVPKLEGELGLDELQARIDRDISRRAGEAVRRRDEVRQREADDARRQARAKQEQQAQQPVILLPKP